jgi:putative RecB family exonuclease
MTAEAVLSPSPAGPPPGPSLSPSRAADFKTCPLLFRFRTIDRLPERPTPDQVRGTLVHAVLERLFDLPAEERTPEAAAALVAPQWERLAEQEPALWSLFDQEVPPVDAPPGRPPTSPSPSSAAPAGPSPSGAAPAGPPLSGGAVAGPGAVLPGLEAAGEAERLAAFLAGASDLLSGYFAVEDPRRLEPAERESLVSTLVDEELLIRGYIDRLDVSPAGDLRVVDYKTGGAPREAFEGRALFQLKFYALVLWRTRGVVPRVLRLLYLKDAEVCDYSPDAAELERFERTLVALSQAIERAKQERDFRPKPSRLCGWCSHQQFCPEFGGTPPPYPEPATTAIPSGAEGPDPAAAPADAKRPDPAVTPADAKRPDPAVTPGIAEPEGREASSDRDPAGGSRVSLPAPAREPGSGTFPAADSDPAAGFGGPFPAQAAPAPRRP